ncbi:helix-turn-helix domain-containing protein [Streptomyces sp. NPDC003388]|uniref:helix-turn-helix domain-containing protein n=1 Tax=unclassified Streptomyces TaxID=2593676 RepID=UPI00116EDFF4|nr:MULTISPECIES: helix-turn-helix transcriptional regulator [unclassified Streptomyces]MDI1458170.1 helix-turn-helix transcriptional regulator [Streptomyces sp. ATE26]GEJ98644.1 transcriptional regulator [Streptomyces sp. 1-11]
MSDKVSDEARVIPLRPGPGRAERGSTESARPGAPRPAPAEPLWRDLVGDVLRRERQAQERTLRDVADAARISLPYLSEIERGRKEASSEVLAAAARALGLDLGDLLSRTRSELVRRTSTAQRIAHRAPRAGLLLAA